MIVRNCCLAAIIALCTAPAAESQQRPQRPPVNGGLPAVSPDGRYIAFVASRGGSGTDLYVMRADGTGELQLTRTPESEGGVRWMPDGRRIKFEQSGMDSSRAFTVNVDGSELRPLVAVAGREIVPTPDGRSIVYNAGRMPNMRLARAAIDGSGLDWLADSGQVVFNPAFSPDGARIAFATFAGERRLQVAVMNADGTGRRLLTNFAAADGSPQWPSWSPDGTSLAVQSGVYNRENPAASTAHIWIVDVATGHATRLAPHDRPWLDETPSFFPDGRRIAFQSDRTGTMEVWVMNVDGSEARQVTR